MAPHKTPAWVFNVASAGIVVVGLSLLLFLGLARSDWAAGAGLAGAAFTLVAAMFAFRTAELAGHSADEASRAARDAAEALLGLVQPKGVLMSHFLPAPATPYAHLTDTDPVVGFEITGAGDYTNVRVGWTLKDGQRREESPARDLIPGRYRADVPSFTPVVEELSPGHIRLVDPVAVLTVVVDEVRTQSSWRARVTEATGVVNEQPLTFARIS